MWARSGLACALLLLFAVGVETGAGQQAPPPVIRSGANAVLVDVFPQRNGQIVEGLTADDFELYEDGKRQTVQTVEFVRIEGDPTPQPDPNGLREMYAFAANPRNRLFVIFLDNGHTTLDGSGVIAGPLADFMTHATGAEDLIGLTTTDLRPQEITFSRDRYRIEQDLRRFWSWGLRQRTTTNRRDQVEEELNTCFHDRFLPTSIEPWMVDDQGVQRYLDQLLIERRREEQVLTALTTLVKYLGRLREARTTLLLMTDGWVLFGPDRRLPAQLKRDTRFANIETGGILGLLDLRRQRYNPSAALYPKCAAELVHLSEINSEMQFRELITLANRSNISFYPVATTGLAAFDNSMSERVTRTPGAFTPTILTRDMGRLRNRVSAARTLAENTDGIAIVQTNDLKEGLRRVADDVSSYYLLGYYPQNQKMDGRYRRLEVKVRQPDLSIKARRGYVATPRNESPREEMIPGPREHGDRILAALNTLPPASERRDLHTRARLESGEIELVVELDGAHGAVPASSRDGAAIRVDLLPRSGSAISASGQIAPRQRSAALRVPLQGQTGPWTAVVSVTYGELLFRDRIDVPVEVAGLLGSASAFRSPASGAPLFMPAADLEFRRAERFRMTWPVSGQLDRSSARLLDRRGQPLLAAVPVVDLMVEGERRLAVDLNVTSLAAGDYVIELAAARGEQNEVRAVAFRVVR